MPNTEDVLGEQEVMDQLVRGVLLEFEDDRITSPAISMAHADNQAFTRMRRLSLPNWSGVTSVGNMLRLESLEVNSLNNNYATSGKTLPRLQHLALRNQSYTGSNNTDPLPHTMIAHGYGAVYVIPSAVSTFRNHSQWGKYRIESTEDYPVEIGSITDSWEDIIAACEDGTYATKYQVGDTKSLFFNNVTTVMRLVAKDADVLDSDGVTTIPTTWVSFIPLFSTICINSSSYKGRSWTQCQARQTLATYSTSLPTAVYDAIKIARKSYCYKTSQNGPYITETRGDSLWIPSMREVLPSDHANAEAYEAEGPHYGLLNMEGPFGVTGGSTASDYTDAWTRTPSNHNTASSCTYYTYIGHEGGGSVSSVAETAYYNVAFGFCI